MDVAWRFAAFYRARAGSATRITLVTVPLLVRPPGMVRSRYRAHNDINDITYNARNTMRTAAAWPLLLVATTRKFRVICVCARCSWTYRHYMNELARRVSIL